MASSHDETNEDGVRAFVPSLDLPDAFRDSTKVLQSHVKVFVKEERSSRLPEAIVAFGAGGWRREEAADILARLGSVTA